MVIELRTLQLFTGGQIVVCLKYKLLTWSAQRVFYARMYIYNYSVYKKKRNLYILLDFSLTVEAVTLIFISGCGSAISSVKEGKSGFIYNLVKS